MPSDNNGEDSVDLAKAFRDLQSAERTAAELEQRLEVLDERLEELLRQLPPEILSSCTDEDSGDDGTDAAGPVNPTNGTRKESGSEKQNTNDEAVVNN